MNTGSNWRSKRVLAVLTMLFLTLGAQAYECGEPTGETGDDEGASCVLGAMKRSASNVTVAAKKQESGDYAAMCSLLNMALYELMPYWSTDWSEYANIGDRPDKMGDFVWDSMKKNKCPEVITRFRRAADKEDPWGYYNLAEAHATGLVVGRDSQLVIEWHQKAIALGYVQSMKALARRYAEDDGVQRDQAKAFELWLMAAKAEEGKGTMNEVANRYLTGNGVEQNYEQAAYWFKKSKDAGSDYAASKLKDMYDTGKVKKPFFSW
ncbi:MAG: hypothetical protein RL375_504 [Pseudomonadota bacterium]|jgi:TPR repeat protein